MRHKSEIKVFVRARVGACECDEGIDLLGVGSRRHCLLNMSRPQTANLQYRPGTSSFNVSTVSLFSCGSLISQYRNYEL